MSTDYTIGLDIGTGSVKAVALDTQGSLLHAEQIHYDVLETAPGRSEQDPEVIVEACISCLQKLTHAIGAAPGLVGFSSYMHGIMALDENNQPLTPVILWSDTRSGAIAKRLRASKQAESIYYATGTPIHSMAPLCKIIWIREHQPDVFKKARRYISIKEYLWLRLFGTFEVDASIANATGLYDIKSNQWNKECLDLCGIQKEQLSEIRATTFLRQAGVAAAQALAGFERTAFCIGGSDGCMANLGSGVTQPGVAALTIGTSGAVRITTDSPVLRFPEMTFSYVLDEKHFVCGGPVNNGGNVLQWLIKKFWGRGSASDQDYAAFFEEIETVPAGCEGLVFLPYIYGERAPVWDEQASGVFLGIRENHSTAHFLRAGLEGICMALKQVTELLEEATRPINVIHISGGFVQSPTWVQMLADVLQKPLVIWETGDASAVGAALIAMKGAGWPEPKPDETSQKRVTPQPANRDAYAGSYAVFKKLYAAVTNIEQGTRNIE